MSEKKFPRGSQKRIDNSLTEFVAGIRTAAMFTGGSSLSSYGGIAYANNYSLITLNRIMLTYLYTTNGIFQTAIQVPVQDAISKGIEIESSELDNDDIAEVFQFWEDNGWWENILDGFSWSRLYGGGALLINSNQDFKKPLSINKLQNTPIELYDLDRWQIDVNAAYFDDFETVLSKREEPEFYYLWGVPIHRSRFLRFKGKRAPSYVRRQLRGWGMSEGERMIRDLNLYLKTQDVLYEILDESKLDIYYIKGLANKMLTTGGVASVTARVQAANELKNYLNALVLDSEEKHESKSLTFSGLAEISKENRVGISSALRIPITKLFGVSSSGFNTGEDDLEQYNQMVESEVRAKLTPPVKKLLQISMSHLWGYVPKFSIKWPAMRVLTEEQEEAIKTQKSDRILSWYDRGLIDSTEAGQWARKDRVFTLETKAEQGLLPPQPTPPGGVESVEPITPVSTKNRITNFLKNFGKKNVDPER